MQLMSVAYRSLIAYCSSYETYQLSVFHRLQDKFNSHRLDSIKEIELFDEAIKQLEQLELQPGLRSHERRTLADLLDIPVLKQWKDGYSTELARLQVKFAEVEAEVRRVGRKDFEPQIDEESCQVNFSELRVTCRLVLGCYQEYRDLCDRYIFHNDAQARAKLHQENWQERLKEVANHTATAERLKSRANNVVQELLETRSSAGVQLECSCFQHSDK
jgi:hypothetical protein